MRPVGSENGFSGIFPALRTGYGYQPFPRVNFGPEERRQDVYVNPIEKGAEFIALLVCRAFFLPLLITSCGDDNLIPALPDSGVHPDAALPMDGGTKDAGFADTGFSDAGLPLCPPAQNPADDRDQNGETDSCQFCTPVAGGMPHSDLNETFANIRLENISNRHVDIDLLAQGGEQYLCSLSGDGVNRVWCTTQPLSTLNFSGTLTEGNVATLGAAHIVRQFVASPYSVIPKQMADARVSDEQAPKMAVFWREERGNGPSRELGPRFGVTILPCVDGDGDLVCDFDQRLDTLRLVAQTGAGQIELTGHIPTGHIGVVRHPNGRRTLVLPLKPESTQSLPQGAIVFLPIYDNDILDKQNARVFLLSGFTPAALNIEGERVVVLSNSDARKGVDVFEPSHVTSTGRTVFRQRQFFVETNGKNFDEIPELPLTRTGTIPAVVASAERELMRIPLNAASGSTVTPDRERIAFALQHERGVGLTVDSTSGTPHMLTHGGFYTFHEPAFASTTSTTTQRYYRYVGTNPQAIETAWVNGALWTFIVVSDPLCALNDNERIVALRPYRGVPHQISTGLVTKE